MELASPHVFSPGALASSYSPDVLVRLIGNSKFPVGVNGHLPLSVSPGPNDSSSKPWDPLEDRFGVAAES